MPASQPASSSRPAPFRLRTQLPRAAAPACVARRSSARRVPGRSGRRGCPADLHRDGPFHDRSDALAQLPGRWSPSRARSEPESRSRRRSSPPKSASGRFEGRRGAPSWSATAGHGGGIATPDSIDPGASALPRRRWASTWPAASRTGGRHRRGPSSGSRTLSRGLPSGRPRGIRRGRARCGGRGS